MVKITERSNSTGWYLDLPKVGRTKFTRHYYDKDSQLIFLGGSKKQIGGALQNFINILMPLGKNKLMALIILLVLDHFNKYKKIQRGGSMSYIDIAEKTLAPLGKNALLVIAALLLLDYLSNKKTKLIGGNINNTFQKKLIQLLQSKHNKQKGGAIINNLYGIIMPLGVNNFSATTLLILLDVLFSKKNISQRGGGNLFCVLRKLLMPMGINKFLATLGLVALTQTNKERKLKGGDNDCGCGGLLNQKGGTFGNNNCGCGNNALEVVGDKALNYSKNLQQFGCKMPEWGYNLYVDGPQGQTKCI